MITGLFATPCLDTKISQYRLCFPFLFYTDGPNGPKPHQLQRSLTNLLCPKCQSKRMLFTFTVYGYCDKMINKRITHIYLVRVISFLSFNATAFVVFLYSDFENGSMFISQLTYCHLPLAYFSNKSKKLNGPV